jgi:molybdopterin-containing oxidoreductase family iron-sulfur binding subunit
MLHREFPRQASEWVDNGEPGTSRRDFLKLMSASMALAGLTACTKQPLEPIVPYVRQPEEITLGKPLFFATANTVGGYAVPVLAESHEGRPTKIEGNPQHPATLGGTDVFTQASILGLYDPDRSQTVMLDNEIRTWGAFVGALANPLAAQKAVQGAGLRLLTRSTTSPTLGAQIKQFLETYPQAKWVQYDPAGRDNVRAGSQLAFGQYVDTQYNFEKADVILSLDGDFLSSGFAGFHKYARQFSARRSPDLKEKMVRFYAAESTPTNTGGKADHRIPMRATEIESFARAVSAGLGNGGPAVASKDWGDYASMIANDLQKHKGAAVVVVGDNQPPAVHALAHAMNAALGAAGNTVIYTEAVEATPIDQAAAMRELVGEMNAGKVDMLVVMGANPAYDAPADLGFLDAYKKVALRIHHGLYVDETAVYSHWHVHGTHYLEQWGDVRAFDGTVTIQQPLIAPLYGGKSQYEFVSALNGQGSTGGYEAVRTYWQKQHTGADFEPWWRRAVHDGLIAGSAATAKNVSAKSSVPAASAGVNDSAMEIIFRRDPMIYDGEYANNGWLQEAPKPYTQLTWDNAILINANTAHDMGLDTEDEVELTLDGRTVKGGIWKTPGHPKNSITVFLGYGRTHAGRVGNGPGFSAYQIRSSQNQWVATGVQVKKTGKKFLFATTQGWQNMDGRDIVRVATLEDFIANPDFAHEKTEAPTPGLTLFEAPYKYGKDEYKWGMAIDLNSCVGCKSCVVACVAENNIPVVGKELVKRGRHMHWLRVDNYHEGTVDNPKTYTQPVPCQQCENAPCELVCPVGATVHSTEGLNDMVYNRCVGTRYCSNNCPYKVRRFNFLLYQDWDTPQYKMMRNPDVSVRSRGVMEKCNYCVQRITHGRINAEREDRKVRDGEIVTACAQACPADAIVFGDLNDDNSRVAKLRAQQRNYGLLEELNNRPRTTYMAVVRNPNPELERAMDQREHATEQK